MPAPSVTYTFSNSTTADATQVNQNFTDLINAMSDGTKDFSISALTVAGNASFNGNVTFGNASGDDVTFTGSLASSIPIKTTNIYNIGASTLGLLSIYFGSSGGAFTTRVIGGAAGSSYTLTLPTTGGTVGQNVRTDGSGGLSFEYPYKVTSKTTTYTATGDEAVILCSTAGGAWTLTLPAAASFTNKAFYIKKTTSDANALTIDGNGSETIDGATTYLLRSQYECVMIVSDGSNWYVANKDSLKLFTAYVTFSGGTPTATTELGGDWISSITDSATGQITLNLNTAFFAIAPMVAAVGTESASSGLSVMVNTVTTSSTIPLRLRDLAATLTDGNFYIVAMEQK